MLGAPTFATEHGKYVAGAPVQNLGDTELSPTEITKRSMSVETAKFDSQWKVEARDMAKQARKDATKERPTEEPKPTEAAAATEEQIEPLKGPQQGSKETPPVAPTNPAPSKSVRTDLDGDCDNDSISLGHSVSERPSSAPIPTNKFGKECHKPLA